MRQSKEWSILLSSRTIYLKYLLTLWRRERHLLKGLIQGISWWKFTSNRLESWSFFIINFRSIISTLFTFKIFNLFIKGKNSLWQWRFFDFWMFSFPIISSCCSTYIASITLFFSSLSILLLGRSRLLLRLMMPEIIRIINFF